MQPDISHILFTVYDAADIGDIARGEMIDSPIAYSSIPLSCFRYGLRTVFLYDEKGNKKGDYSFASLLIRTACESWIVSTDDNGKQDKNNNYNNTLKSRWE